MDIGVDPEGLTIIFMKSPDITGLKAENRNRRKPNAW